MCVCGLLVPSAPRGLQLSIVQSEPPVISAVWQVPRQTHGPLTSYRLQYRVIDDPQLPAAEQLRQLDAEKYRFTTGFLGQSGRDVAEMNLGWVHPSVRLGWVVRAGSHFFQFLVG